MTKMPTCATCKHAVVKDIPRVMGADPVEPFYPFECVLAESNDGDPKIEGTLAVAVDAEQYSAGLLVKATYGCPQHVHTEDLKLVTYHHGSVTREELQRAIDWRVERGWQPGDTETLLRSYSITGGRRFTGVEELRAAFEARFATGAKVVPNPLREPCEGWADETGCPGHTIPVGTKPT